MKNYNFQIFIVLVSISVAASRNYNDEELTHSDVNKIQKLIHDLKLQDSSKHEEIRHSHHHDDHDRTNIETLNLIFKHNNIGRPIARVGEREDQIAGVSRCLLGRCGCGGGAARCGCGRSGDPCDVDHDHVNDNIILLNRYPDDADDDDTKININKYHDNNQERKNRVDNDAKIEKFLNNLENALVSVDSRENGGPAGNLKLNCNEESCRLMSFDYNDKISDSDDNVVQFLNELEEVLTDDNVENNKASDYNDDDDEKSYLRCCKKCGSSRSYRSYDVYNDSEDDKAYLRCCKKCGRNKYFRTVNGESVEESGEDDRAYLRCCKKCGSSKYYRTADDEDQKAYLRCCRKCGRSNDQETNDERAAKIFQINDDLDAIVIDVSDLDNILKLVNNGNNLDNENSVRDYIRAGQTKLVPKQGPHRQRQRKSSLLPMTVQQKMKLKQQKRQLRRSQKPDVERYGLPFELDVQGLGQVNP